MSYISMHQIHLLNENLLNFMNHTVQFGYQYWITGIAISVIALLIGVTKFAKQNRLIEKG